MAKGREHRSIFHYQEIHLQHLASNAIFKTQQPATGTPHAALFCHGIKARNREKFTIIPIILTKLQQN